MLLQEIFDNRPTDKKHKDAAIAALHRRLASKGDKESVASAAYEVGRAFGIPTRELEKMYKEVYEAKGKLTYSTPNFEHEWEEADVSSIIKKMYLITGKSPVQV